MGGRGRQISEFKASQVYRASSRMARDAYREILAQQPPTKKYIRLLGQPMSFKKMSSVQRPSLMQDMGTWASLEDP